VPGLGTGAMRKRAPREGRTLSHRRPTTKIGATYSQAERPPAPGVCGKDEEPRENPTALPPQSNTASRGRRGDSEPGRQQARGVSRAVNPALNHIKIITRRACFPATRDAVTKHFKCVEMDARRWCCAAWVLIRRKIGHFHNLQLHLASM